MTLLTVHEAGPGLTVQDLGRPGHMASGLSRGGAADRLALFEAAALLGQPAPLAALEMAGAGGRFSTDAPTRLALTGARMRAEVDGRPVPPNTTLLLAPGELLRVAGAEAGTYGYLAFAGGVLGPDWLGSRAAHLAAGIGRPLAAGQTLPLGPDPATQAPALALAPQDRLSGGPLRLMPGPQTALFGEETRRRFAATRFTRAHEANRQGVKLAFEGAPFASDTSGLASDFISPGDVQMTGAGHPYVLLCECQTIGGYPRIGTVIAADLPRLAQAPAGTELRFLPVSADEADALWESDTALLARLRKAAAPATRDPRDIPDLLRYQLVDGATRGDELEEE